MPTWGNTDSIYDKPKFDLERQARGNTFITTANTTIIGSNTHIDSSVLTEITSPKVFIDGAASNLYTTANTTIPSAVFSAGDIICVYNNSASSITIKQGTGVTMRLVGTTFTGDRTLAQRGFCTIHCTTNPSTFIVGGGGLT